MWNRGKKSVVLDLKTETGRASAKQLALTADVVIEAFRPGVMERFMLGYPELSAVRPRLVYCSITGFDGAVGSSAIQGYEAIVAGRTGLLAGLDVTQGAPPDHPATKAIYKVIPVNSYAASQLALQGICSALYKLQSTGAGDHVRTSLLQGATALVMRQEFRKVEHIDDDDRKRSLLMRGLYLTFLTVQCRDGKWIQMCARQDHHFANWMKALGLESILGDPRYAGGPLAIPTVADIEELEALVRNRMGEETQDYWMDLFINKFDVGADPFLTPDEFLRHPQMTENQRVIEIEDPDVGRVLQPGPLVLFSETPSAIRRGAPKLGEDSASILDSLQSRETKPIMNGNSIAADGPRSTAPLAGLTILEISMYLAGPLAATILAELGARVIKIETPEGDPWRRIGLEAVHLLHGKESVVLDLKSDGGRDAVHKLIEKADVLLTSFRPGVPDRLGFGYLDAIRINPRLVYVYAASYGSRGPQRHRPAFHSTPNALSGGGILQAGHGNPPVDDSYPDPVAALAAGSAIAMGLLARNQTGKGQYIETTMLCSTAYAMSPYLVRYEGAPDWRLTNNDGRGVSALQRLYDCAGDTTLLIDIEQQKEWDRLVECLGLPELDHVDFAHEAGRETHDGRLRGILAGIFSKRSAAEWEAVLRKADVAGVQVTAATIGGFLLANHMLLDATSNLGDYYRLPGRIKFANAAIKLADASAVGENTSDVLSELGYSQAHVASLLSAG
jgi:crotonobetainyl-CoA:carnitine CoA-transferase CaiB-like acyl-CoA transferase